MFPKISLLPASRFLLFPVLIFCLAAGFSFAQNPAAPQIVLLELNKTLQRQFSSAGEKHSYQLNLAANQFMQATVAQHDIDVTISLFKGDADKPFAQFDFDPRPQGVETVEFVAAESGIYRVVVAPRYKNLFTGNYEIKLDVLRDATENDRTQQQARDLAASAARLYQARKYDESIAEADRALLLLEKTGAAQSFFYSLIVKREGNIFSERGDYPKAEEYFLRSVKMAEESLGADDPRVAEALSNLAVIYKLTGKYDKSESVFQRALNIQEKTFGENHPATVVTLGNFATLYRQKGDYNKAEAMHLRSLAVREKIYGADQPELLPALSGLSTVYYEKKDYLKAREVDERALKIAEKSYDKDDPRLETYLNNVALTYTELGDYAQAEPMLKRAVAISEKAYGADSLNLSGPLNNLGELYTYIGDYDKSNAYFAQSLKILEKSLPAGNPRIAEALGNLAGNYLFRGEYAQAEPLLQKQLAIREAALGAEHPDVAKSLNSLARLYENENDVAQAVKYQTRVNDLLEKYNQLNLYAGSEKQQLAYFDYLSEQTDQLISMETRFPDNEAARNLAATAVLQRKGRVQDILADSLTVLRRRFAPQDQKLLSDLSETNSQLAEVVTGDLQKENAAARQAKIKTLTERKEALENEISRLSAGFYQQEPPLSLDALQAKIPADAALLEFAIYHPFHMQAKTAKSQYEKPHYVAYVIHRDGGIEFKELGDAEQIDEAIKAFRNSLRNPKSIDVAQTARAVSEKIIAPLRNLFGNATHLIVSPDGELNLIPFEALVDENGHYLIENFSFTYLTSGRDLLRMHPAQNSAGKPLIIANPLFGVPEQASANVKMTKSLNRSKRASVVATRSLNDTYFAPLGGTVSEARTIQELFPDSIFLNGAQATESALKQTSAPLLLHIATHGFFLEDKQTPELIPTSTRSASPDNETENPMLRSGLALAGANQRLADNAVNNDDDGILTALEASGLNLWGTKLVVLSACDTGLGEVKNGEGVYGLRRAFVLAGAESLVMSLWSVSDYTTRELMKSYYKNLKQGMGRGAALRQVQLEILKQKGREHPFYWAAFIESGEWANLDGNR